MKMRALLVVLASALFASTAMAEIQKEGSEVWPGKVQIGVHPLGGQIGFNGNSVSGYKLAFDVAGLVAPLDKLSIWVGGGVNYTAGLYYCYSGAGVGIGAYCGHDIQFWAFVMLTFEKLVTKIPLVPFARAGIAGDILYFGQAAGGVGPRIGAGAHYYLTKNIGLGFETNFTFGAAFHGPWNGTLLYGAWDIGLGARFAF